MEYDWRFSYRSKCSEQEKHQCMELVADLVNLSIMARRNGLLSLIQVSEQSSSFLLNKGLQLVVDGVTPEVARNVMENYIISGDYTGKALLQRCIILEGIIAIQQGLHPKVTKEFLLSFLGEDNDEIYQKEYEEGSEKSLESYLKKNEETSASSSQGTKLDQVILKLDHETMEKFLMEINTDDLAKSLKGMGGPAQIKIFDTLSKKAAHALKDTIEDLDSIDESDLVEIQETVLEIISELQEQTPGTAFN